ncbi:MAG: radical SAM protein [Phycisphaerales bacterium]
MLREKIVRAGAPGRGLGVALGWMMLLNNTSLADPSQEAWLLELRRRAAVARRELSACQWCALRCGADRTAGTRGPCGAGAETFSFKRHVSFAEEIELLPSYMVYLAGCNLRCAFCVQAPACFDPSRGLPVASSALAEELIGVVARGARTINLLGGEPSIHLHTILEITVSAAERGVRLPLVLNSNFYMTPHALDLLEGVVEIYLADLKFGNDDCAMSVAGVPGYTGVVRENLKRAEGRGGLLVRHLLMPGHVECCLRPTAEWVAANLPGARFSLMTGYVPAYRAARGGAGELGRVADDEELERGAALVCGLGLRGEGP